MFPHLGAMATAALPIFIVVRVYLASNLNTATALTIISEAGTGSVIVGTLAQFAPALGGIFFLLSVWWWSHATLRSGEVVPAALGLIAAAALVVAVSPWLVSLISLPVVAATAWSYFGNRRRRGGLLTILREEESKLAEWRARFMMSDAELDAALVRLELNRLELSRSIQDMEEQLGVSGSQLPVDESGSDRADNGVEETLPALRRKVSDLRAQLLDHYIRRKDDLNSQRDRLRLSFQALDDDEAKLRASIDALPPEPDAGTVPAKNTTEGAFRAITILTIGVLMGNFLLQLIHTEPWFPLERVEVSSGGEIGGYVISVSDGWATIMRDGREREIVRIRSDLIRSRQNCSRSKKSGLLALDKTLPILIAQNSRPTPVTLCNA